MNVNETSKPTHPGGYLYLTPSSCLFSGCLDVYPLDRAIFLVLLASLNVLEYKDGVHVAGSTGASLIGPELG